MRHRNLPLLLVIGGFVLLVWFRLLREEPMDIAYVPPATTLELSEATGEGEQAEALTREGGPYVFTLSVSPYSDLVEEDFLDGFALGLGTAYGLMEGAHYALAAADGQSVTAAIYLESTEDGQFATSVETEQGRQRVNLEHSDAYELGQRLAEVIPQYLVEERVTEEDTAN